MRKALSVACVLITLLGNGCGSKTLSSNDNNSVPSPSPNIFSKGEPPQWITQFGTGTVVRPTPTSFPYPGELVSGIVSGVTSNSFVVGYTVGTFPGFEENKNNIAQPFVKKVDAQGRDLWLRQFTNGAGAFINSATLDKEENLFFTGSTLGTFPGNSFNPGVSQGILGKMDTQGNLQWIRQYSFPKGELFLRLITQGGDGSLYIAGYLSTGKSTQDQALWVAKFNPLDGAIVWSKTFGSDVVNNVFAVKADNAGGLYLSGLVSGEFPGTTEGESSPYLVKLSSSDGQVIWSQQFSELRKEYRAILINSIDISITGDLALGGARSSTYVVVGQGAMVDAQLLLASVSAKDGAVQWTRSWSTGKGDQVSSIKVSSNGEIYATGSTNGVFHSAFKAGVENLFLLKCKSDGTPISIQQFGNGDLEGVPYNQFGANLAVDLDGDILITGLTQGSYNDYPNANKAVEVFIAKFKP